MAKKYIDADSLGEFIMNEYLKTTDNDSYVLFALGYMAGAIEKTPSADVRENIHAHWIQDGQYQYRCSNCGEYISGDADATPYINKFCWNCGADMRGEQDDSK